MVDQPQRPFVVRLLADQIDEMWAELNTLPAEERATTMIDLYIGADPPQHGLTQPS
jgi:hypothetical protein